MRSVADNRRVTQLASSDHVGTVGVDEARQKLLDVDGEDIAVGAVDGEGLEVRLERHRTADERAVECWVEDESCGVLVGVNLESAVPRAGSSVEGGNGVVVRK